MATDFTLVINPAPQFSATLTTGQGPAGPPGSAGSTYEHAQPVAASEWIVNHNLGFRPNIAVLSVGGVEMVAEVLHVSVNQARVYFDSATTGLALCS